MNHEKDRSLDWLANFGNVAQFVSFVPGEETLRQTYCRISGYEANHPFATVREAITALLAAAPDGTVNIRSYAPDSPRSREFVYAIDTVDAALENLDRLATEGLHLIVNETVDVADGGVSGVAQGDVIEFAPDDTPRCVEKPGTVSLPLEWGLDLLSTVYGFRPALAPANARIEFSVHPKPRGWKRSHTLLWEREETPEQPAQAATSWPNRFSRHLGDKVYGLIMAHILGAHVPETLVINRRVAPFRFGRPTNSDEVWIRTSPNEQEPGLFTTRKGWTDPFRLMAEEDPKNERIASVLAQSAIPAIYSGAAVEDANGDLFVEGVAGEGDLFMLGRSARQDLPKKIVADVEDAVRHLRRALGPVRIEWVHDGTIAWIVQMHSGAATGTAHVLVPGTPARWTAFDVNDGLEALRALLRSIDPNDGIELLGNVGMTSHIADLVRKAGVPARIAATATA